MKRITPTSLGFHKTTLTILTFALTALLYTAASAQAPLSSEASKAQPALEASNDAPPSSPITAIGDDTTQLIVDTEQHTVRIIIEGREVGRFDAKGLHVFGDIEYSGFSTDTNGSQPPAP